MLVALLLAVTLPPTGADKLIFPARARHLPQPQSPLAKRQSSSCASNFANSYCCSSTTYCFTGEVCCTNGYCCPGGSTCLEDTRQCSSIADGFGTGILAGPIAEGASSANGTTSSSPAQTTGVLPSTPNVSGVTTVIVVTYQSYYISTTSANPSRILTSTDVQATSTVAVPFSAMSGSVELSSYFASIGSAMSQAYSAEASTGREALARAADATKTTAVGSPVATASSPALRPASGGTGSSSVGLFCIAAMAIILGVGPAIL